MMARAMTASAMIGTITAPPALISSNTPHLSLRSWPIA
jgi:hypothetical protein